MAHPALLVSSQDTVIQVTSDYGQRVGGVILRAGWFNRRAQLRTARISYSGNVIAIPRFPDYGPTLANRVL